MADTKGNEDKSQSDNEEELQNITEQKEEHSELIGISRNLRRSEEEKRGSKVRVPLKYRIRRSKKHKPLWNVYPTVSLNEKAANTQRKFPSNRISTTKYTVWNFVPKNLLEQFRRTSNFYFLIITIITLIPQVSPLTPITSILPLLFVLGVSAIKEAYEDYKRAKADRKVNNAKYSVLVDEFEKKVPTASKDIKVGDWLYLEKDQTIPADVVIFRTGLEEGICYVDTAQLDGETNLKLFRTIPQTFKYLPKELMTLKGEIECEAPHHLLDTFHGKLILGEQTFSLDAKQLLLRGARLRNTPYVYGMVVYSGPDTKLSLNQKEPPSKFSRMEKIMNKVVIGIFVFKLLLSIICTICASIFQRYYGQYAGTYLEEFSEQSIGLTAVLAFFAYFVLLSFLIPMSMFVTLELVKVAQTMWMEWDVNLRLDPEDPDSGMNAKTSNLNDELALVKYVFSDKTGTLTENKMEFAKCSIAGHKHENIDVLKGEDEEHSRGIVEFLRVMALCQGGVPEVAEDGTLKFQSQSPDEVALLKFAQQNNFVFTARESDKLAISERGQELKYRILNVLEFTSKRARMSVILRTLENKIIMYSKGADSVMLPRLVQNEKLEELTKEHINGFSTEGLRTLIVARRELNEDEYQSWNKIFHEAITSLEDRTNKVEKASELIEQKLELIGCTAIEDKLQEGVPDTIEYLLQAGIKVWIITGDKQETAINIGKSTNLLKPGLDVVVINADNSELCGELFEKALEKYYNGRSKKERPEIGLVIDGKTLVFALTEYREELLKLSTICNSVVCCRVTPLQKAQIVRLIKESSGQVCLSIGDGANDVSMIQEAHIGVGIYGKEGTQAARASDYAIQQFQHLRRLMCVHGRYSMIRNALTIHSSLYKNMAFFLVQFWFSFFSGFSAQTLYDDWIVTAFNIIFTSLPPLIVGCFEKDLTEKVIAKHPPAFKFVQNYKAFNRWTVSAWLLSAFYHSIIFFVFSVLIFYSFDWVLPGGKTLDQWTLAAFIATVSVMTVLAKISLHTTYWVWVNHVSIWLSILVYFATYMYLTHSLSFWPIGYGVFYQVFRSPAFYLAFFLTFAWALLPDFSFLAFKRDFHPQSYQVLQARYLKHPPKETEKELFLQATAQRVSDPILDEDAEEEEEEQKEQKEKKEREKEEEQEEEEEDSS